MTRLLCRLRSIAAHRDHFVRCLSVRLSVCLSGSHTFLVVTHSYVSQATPAFLGMLPLFYQVKCKIEEPRDVRNSKSENMTSSVMYLAVFMFHS